MLAKIKMELISKLDKIISLRFFLTPFCTFPGKEKHFEKRFPNSNSFKTTLFFCCCSIVWIFSSNSSPQKLPSF